LQVNLVEEIKGAEHRNCMAEFTYRWLQPTVIKKNLFPWCTWF